MKRVVVLGAGRMGRLVADLARERGLAVTGPYGQAALAGGLPEDARGAEAVAIEFTTADAAPALVRACAARGLPVVSGTTGWDDARARTEEAVRTAGGAMLWSPNFALGMHRFARVVAEAARLLVPAAGFDAHLVDTHHAAKRDAPSGTAKRLAAIVREARGADVPVTSIRTGAVPGTHALVFDAAFEQVRLVHEARDRRVFADGALAAAAWLHGRRGVFTMDDLLDGARP